MDKIISYLLNWIEFIIHIYIHITATINAVIFVANNSRSATNTKAPTTAEEIILQRRRRSGGNTKLAQKTTTTIRRRQPTATHSFLLPQRQLQYQRRSTTAIFGKHQPEKNYLANIPNEILLVIFEFMDQVDLYHCSTVTKHWNELATPILWKSPVPNQPILSCSPLPLFAAFLDKKGANINHHQQQQLHISQEFPIHLSRYGHAVKSLDLSQIASNVNDCTIRHIVRYCPHLTSLNLSHCRWITNEGLRSLSSTVNLKVLVLQNCRQITDIGLSYLQQQDGLETLHLGGCNRISDGGVIGLVTASGRAIRRINLSDCNRVTGSTIHAIARICGPRLEWLDIARTRAIKHTDLEYLVNICPNITRLNVSMKKPKSLFELRNQLAFTTVATARSLFHSHDEEVVADYGQADDGLVAVDTDTTATAAQQDDITINEEEEEEENPLNELLELLHQFNIQPTLTTGSAQHQQYLIEQQRLKDSVSNYTIELIAMNLKKLEYLNLSYWNCLNDKAVHTLSIHSHCLTYLNLIGCSSVTRKVLRYLSDLCERKSTCITLSDLMISPTHKSYENKPSFWVITTAANTSSSSSSSSSVSSSSSSEEEQRRRRYIKSATKQHAHNSRTTKIWA